MELNNIPSLDFEAGMELCMVDDAVTSRNKIIGAIITGIAIGVSS
ncbi:MAG TPA: hypothetical protein VLA64_06415 [Azonexus sp.]|jgi:hypothetical protein|nr:hypothetical protein [Azonexus sp.]